MGKIIHGNFNTNIKLRKKTVAIIAAGGKGTRMGLDFNKIFLSVHDKPILAYTLDVFEQSDAIDSVILVCSEEDEPLCKEILSEFGYGKVTKIVRGGKTRQESVRNGLNAIESACDIVLIHDAARPLVTEEMIESTIDSAHRVGAAAVGVSPVDTVKRVHGTTITDTLNRSSLILIQTPQAFRKEIIEKAHRHAFKNEYFVNDDCELCELIEQPVTVVPGSKANIKLTTPEDFAIISAFLSCYRDDEEDDDE